MMYLVSVSRASQGKDLQIVMLEFLSTVVFG